MKWVSREFSSEFVRGKPLERCFDTRGTLARVQAEVGRSAVPQLHALAAVAPFFAVVDCHREHRKLLFDQRHPKAELHLVFRQQ